MRPLNLHAMTVKIIWGFIGLNSLALLWFIGATFLPNNGKTVDLMEKQWSVILSGIALLIILAAALPLRFSQSTAALIFSGIFAVFPFVIVAGVYISNSLPSLRRPTSFAKTYYADKTQRKIATAIETNDTTSLLEFIRGQDLNIQGNRVWDWDGLNYLQFAIRIRSNPTSFPFDEKANTAAIRILLEHGSAATPALVDGAIYLPPSTFKWLLDAGADPDTRSLYNGEPVLFSVIDAGKDKIDKAILLVSKGANINVKNSEGSTPLLFAADRASTYERWNDAWRFVYYLLTEAGADYRYTRTDGKNLQTVIRKIRKDARENNLTLSPEFLLVKDWLTKHGIDTEPV